MDARIAQGLKSLFDKHRIVFWYDANRELREAYEAVDLSDVEKIEIDGNEFGIKHRILRDAPRQKFLLYRYGPEPEQPIDNWLLDVQLAHGTFRTDQVAIWLTELGLGIGFEDLLKAHEEFFRAGRRVERLKPLMKPDDTRSALRLKMLAVCAGADPNFDSVVEALLGELAEGRDDRLKLIHRVGLDDFLWEQMGRHFGYRAPQPGVGDFAIELFKSCYAMGIGGDARLSPEALVFFKRWKNNRNCMDAFETLSEEYAGVLGIEADVRQRDFRTLIELDYFREIDRHIIRSLVHELSAQTVPHGDAIKWARQRRQSHWHGEFSHLYAAIACAAELLQAMVQMALGMEDMTDGVRRYAAGWFRIDQLYRKFVYHTQQAAQASLMSELAEMVENHYANSFVLKLNDLWQFHVDKAERWDVPSIMRQGDFFATRVAPFRRKDQKVSVIISDAMRYEVGEELLMRVRGLDRYDAEIEPALSALPSYTQLGMASLLPHKEIRIADNDTGAVIVDDVSSQGLANRQKILEAGRPDDRVAACRAEEVMAMTGDEARALFRDTDILYIYHNRIDATGDKLATEERVFEAAEDTLEELVKLVRKLTAANVTNLLVTADHGFLYQNRPIEESDFSGAEVAGEAILYRDRRFVLGKGLAAHAGLRKFTSAQLGLSGEVEVLIPKSINRLRLKGSGSRFVHGGASLQEVVIPVVRINKKRQSDVSAVDVDIVGSPNRTITSSQISVLFYQSGPVTEKTQPRTLRAGIFAPSGVLISDSHDLEFDSRSENARDREMPVRFLLSKTADEFNGQEVTLKLEEQHAGTSHYKEYRTARYLLRRSFTSDFDF